jgi:4-hydroxythreonine-4-phosphate dehydrogenase
MKNKLILIVAGEPNSVFSEILFKSLKSKKIKKNFILICSKNLLIGQMKKLGYHFKIKIIDKENFKFEKEKINIIDINFKFKNVFDKISDKSNKYLEDSFRVGLDLLKTNNFLGLINGPISKKNFLKKKFPGITEYLAKKCIIKDDVAMLIYNKKLSVSPITTHLPLKEVHACLTKKKIINHVKLIDKFYKRRFKKVPKIAITGLNPHCESNYKSSEEKKIIKPAINFLTTNKYKVSGPFPADTIFLKEISKKYDVIVGMYHDQVLAPIKAIFGFNAINITLGLPFIRVSPDHGPNESMIGKNKSNPRSLIQAINFLNK